MNSSHISPSAKIHPSVKIGPYCTIGDNVEIDENSILHSHIAISGFTKIGKNNVFFPFSSIGSDPQDLKYNGEKSFLVIGNNNTFRENVTVNPGTKGGGLYTRIENDCLFMVGSHIAHDCIIGSNVILANNATLAGHVEIDNSSIIGGNSAIHQFVKVGKNAMVGGMSGLEKNLIPYGLYIGIRSNLKGLNLIGLKRKGLNNNKIKNLNHFIENIFDKNDSIENNLNKISNDIKLIDEVIEIINFIAKSNQRGLVTL
ncbi:acyl-ACP--UDP-N-acetylglucosamine O-acyltransferase [Pelagibacterales bacterium SAG-MED31]|nr:acyl-ACP--UDP-N-acetylglucosamine O-acyltransferase [Pelagibacterales bacterium SAG-MED31]